LWWDEESYYFDDVQFSEPSQKGNKCASQIQEMLPSKVFAALVSLNHKLMI
jgi:hypothetical protein